MDTSGDPVINRTAPIRFYRGYRIYRKCPDKGRPVHFNFKTVNYHLPRRFVWLGGGDEELNSYIDSLVERRKLDSSKFEDGGLVVELAYVDPPKSSPMVTIQPEMLVAIILGEIPIECPIDTVLKFRSSPSGRYVPDRIIAELASNGIIDAYYAGLQQFIETGRPIALHEHLDGVKPTKYDQRVEGPPCINLIEAEKQGKGTVVDRPPASPPEEETVDPVGRPDGSTEVVSLVIVEPPYYVKRRFDSDGALLRAWTAWSVEGPWS